MDLHSVIRVFALALVGLFGGCATPHPGLSSTVLEESAGPSLEFVRTDTRGGVWTDILVLVLPEGDPMVALGDAPSLPVTRRAYLVDDEWVEAHERRMCGTGLSLHVLPAGESLEILASRFSVRTSEPAGFLTRVGVTLSPLGVLDPSVVWSPPFPANPWTAWGPGPLEL